MDSLGEHNPLIKQIRRAVQRGTLTEGGFAVAEGWHLLEEAVKAGCEIRAVIVSESAKPELIELVSRTVEPRQVNAKLFRALSSTETPQGVLALVKPPAADLPKMLASRSGEGALVMLIDGVQDPGNAGAIVRVAEAFGATGAIFLKGSVDPFHPRVLRGSAGSSFRLPILAGIEAEAIRDLPLAALPIYAAMPCARSSVAIGSVDFTTPCAIAIGGEGHGVGAALAAHSTPVHIPTEHVESLNAAVAAGIFLYEARRQRDACEPPQREPGDARRQTDARGEAGR
jgi:TrmH family RNA methyltransferase